MSVSRATVPQADLVRAFVRGFRCVVCMRPIILGGAVSHAPRCCDTFTVPDALLDPGAS